MADKLAKVSKFAALSPVDSGGMGIQEIVALNMGGAHIDPTMLDRVKVPTGGSLTWEVPTIEGETEATKELVGVIVGIQNIRSYYATEWTGGNEPPDCSSRDGIYGEPRSETAEGYGGRCSACQMSKWKSGKNGGQACSQRRLVLLLREESLLPIVLNVPPTSLLEMDRYLLRLTAKRLPFFKVVTSFKLAKETSQGGITYATIAPSFVRMLEEDEASAAGSMFQSLRAVFGKVAEDAAEEGF